MNIFHIPEAAATFDKFQFIRRDTEIDIEFHKFVNYAEGSADEDVKTMRGLAAYYRKGFQLYIQGEQIRKYAPGSSENYAVTLN